MQDRSELLKRKNVVFPRLLPDEYASKVRLEPEHGHALNEKLDNWKAMLSFAV